MNTSSDLSARLKAARLKRGFSQNDVAEKLNVSRQAVSRWETGKGLPDLNTILCLSDMYGVSTDELLGKAPALLTEPTSKGNTDSLNLEFAFLIILLALSSFLPIFLNIICSAGVLIWTLKNRKQYKLIIIFSIMCILSNTHNSLVFINGCFDIWGVTEISKIR